MDGGKPERHTLQASFPAHYFLHLGVERARDVAIGQLCQGIVGRQRVKSWEVPHVRSEHVRGSFTPLCGNNEVVVSNFLYAQPIRELGEWVGAGSLAGPCASHPSACDSLVAAVKGRAQAALGRNTLHISGKPHFFFSCFLQ